MLTVTVVLAAHPALAASYAVGTCKPTLPSFENISTAVSSVPPSSTVLVCPGTYPEQVTISQPLTLTGVAISNSAQAVITVPAGGFLTLAPDALFGPLSPQVMVTAGPVTLTNITVDGTGFNSGNLCSGYLVGIFYASGSSGTVNEVTTRKHFHYGCGIGILAANETSTNESVTIQNSSFHDFDGYGINVATNQTPPTLTATIKGNTVDGGDAASTGIATYHNAGSVTGNIVSAGVALDLVAPASTASGKITNSGIGIVIAIDGASATSNKISKSEKGIVILAGGATVQSNTITRATTGIEFSCNVATVAHNTIDDATVGLADVPASFGAPNTFFNLSTIRTGGC